MLWRHSVVHFFEAEVFCERICVERMGAVNAGSGVLVIREIATVARIGLCPNTRLSNAKESKSPGVTRVVEIKMAYPGKSPRADNGSRGA